MLCTKPTLKKIIEQIVALNPTSKDLILIYAGDKCKVNYFTLVQRLNKLGITFMGAIFPAVIHQNQILDNAVIINKIKLYAKPVLIKDGAPSNLKMTTLVTKLKRKKKKLTALIFLDQQVNNVYEVLYNLQNQLLNKVNYLGGASGSLDHPREKSIFCNDGFFKKVSICCLLDLESSLGEGHGYQATSEPLIATRTDGNLIQELNWQNPFNVYKQALKNQKKLTIKKSTFLEKASNFPFGIYTEGKDFLVKDLRKLNQKGEILCFSKVPENAILNILEVKGDSLIQGAIKAARQACEKKTKRPKHHFIFACCSRSFSREEEFSEEIKQVCSYIQKKTKTGIPEGAMTIGEVASHGNGVIEFMNKTVVIGAMY